MYASRALKPLRMSMRMNYLSDMTIHTRKPTNLSLDPELLAEAKALNINLSRAAEDGVRRAVAEELGQRWKAENADALDSSNDYAAQSGLPLDGARQF